MLYVYAITADHAGEGDEGLPQDSILPGVPVRRFAFGSLSAIASPVPEEVFGPQALPARLEDMSWTRERVLAHDAVVGALVPLATVLPLKFCTLFSGPDALEAAIARNRETFEAVVERLRGAREWGVKIFSDPPASAAPSQASELAAPGAGAAFFRRKREEQAARVAAEAALDATVAASHQRLAACSRAAVVSPVQPTELHRQPGVMVLNGSYLVTREGEAAWRDCLSDLERENAAAGLRYMRTGPWAAYHFTGGGFA